MKIENIRILIEKEIESELKGLPSWRREGDKIVREFEFKDFTDALDFINSMAPFFQEQDHHPDINWSYKKVLFSLTRYSIGGKLTDKDFTVAREIEKRLLEKRKKKD